MSNPLEAVVEAQGLERWSHLDAVRVCPVQGSARRTLPGSLVRDVNGASPWES